MILLILPVIAVSICLLILVVMEPENNNKNKWDHLPANKRPLQVGETNDSYKQNFYK